MAELGNLVPLRQVVANILNDLGVLADAGNTIRYTQWGIRGMRKVSTFFGSWVETKKITMTSMGTVILPDDYIAFIRIGIPYKGRLWVSTLESNLLVPTDIECGEEVLNEDDENYVIGADTASHFDNTGGQNGEYYRLDVQNNRIIMNGVDRADVTLEYKSNGISMSGDTRIPRIAEESVIAYIHVQRTTFDKDATRYNMDKAERRWMNETTALKRAQEPNIDALYDAIASGYTYGPRR